MRKGDIAFLHAKKTLYKYNCKVANQYALRITVS